ncbi:putative LRR receptor-like serine/threonine-protein kinase [Hordeum vulgare]|nr:putative LRR receptor-like serine/threonine-protein kinase [Hordeum vulgare]
MTATAVAATDLKEVPKQEDTTSSGAADDEEKEAAGMKRKIAKTGFKSPYDYDYDDDEPYEAIPTILVQHDVEDGNKESFIEKEAQKIMEKGKAAYFRRGMFRCPCCTTKPKPRDGIFEHLMSHARGLSQSADQDIKTRAEHAALLKALGTI